MKYINLEVADGVATIEIARGKVNALNGTVVDELRECLKELEADSDTRAVILTGQGKFFSFGFDIPEFLSFSKEEFTDYLINFTNLYTYLFTFPKPVVAALNGHTMAGGCMLALACDSRVMVRGKGRISLNEIAFGSSVFAGSTEMLRFWIGSANTSQVLYSGTMYSAEDAMDLGMIQEVTTVERLLTQARKIVDELAAKHPPAFASIKSLLREPIAEAMSQRERASIDEFVEISNKVEDLALEDRNTSKHKMRIVRILDRSGAIDIQNEHGSSLQARGDDWASDQKEMQPSEASRSNEPRVRSSPDRKKTIYERFVVCQPQN